MASQIKLLEEADYPDYNTRALSLSLSLSLFLPFSLALLLGVSVLSSPSSFAHSRLAIVRLGHRRL